MQAAILCLAIVAYGDSSDYIPPTSAQSNAKTQSTRSRASDFGGVQSSSDFAKTARRRQLQLDNELRNKTRSLPAPLTAGAVRPASGTLSGSVGDNVIRAQHQIDDSWPNRGIDGAGYGRNRAATDPTDMDSRQKFSLTAPRTNTDTDRQTYAAGAGRTAQSGKRSRYIPPGGTTTQNPSVTTLNPRPNDNRSTRLGNPDTTAYGATTRTRTPLTPRYVAADTSDPNENAGGDFGSTGRDTAPARRATDSPFDLSGNTRQYETNPRTENGPPPMTRTPATTYPPLTSDGSTTSRQRRGGNYLPPSSADYPDSQTVIPDSRQTPRVVTQNDRWPVTQPLPQVQPGLTQRSPAVITPNPNQTTTGYDPNRQIFRNDGIERAAADVARAAQTTAYNTAAAVEGGSFMTLLMLFGSIGLNLYLGWIAWDTYNRYQDMVADIRYSSPRRESVRDEYVERVA